ncbi:MAG: glycosyltransferase family 2 protein [Methylocystaceae bacterium]|nr:glycosyltransferase family 2 protein [Methylocystaceae bacterium]
MKPELTTYHSVNDNIQSPFDIAVIIPTILRESLIDAVRSIYAQDFKGRIQIIIGIDQINPAFDFTDILAERPDHVAVTLFWPGYSTNQKNGGTHPVGGGSLRSTLSFLANANALAYLDDANWFAPNHLSSLHDALKGQDWAFSQRWFIDKESRTPLCPDTWESVGPNKGVFANRYNGFVDTNCLMINTLSCTNIFGNWCLSPTNGQSVDHQFFKALMKKRKYGQTGQATCLYVINKNDVNHNARNNYIKKQKLPCGPEHYPDWPGKPQPQPKNQQQTLQTGQYQLFGDHSQSFDCAVVIPTIGRGTLKKTIDSIYQQDFKGRVQILVGLDCGFLPPQLEDGLPDNMGLVLFDPGYSTSIRHGGVFTAHDGGSLRSLLSFLAHARYVAYLDDDNRLRPNHLSCLYQAVQDHHYAYSLRMFMHPNGEIPVSPDYWESLGPAKGVFAYNMNGFIDPNCLMMDVQSCINILPKWTLPFPGDPSCLTADRHLYYMLSSKKKGRCTNKVTIEYRLNEKDKMHPIRALYLGAAWQNACLAALKRQLLATAQKR